MANLTKKPNTIKSIGKKVADNGNADDYIYVPIGADSDNVDRPDGSTVEESLTDIEAEKVEIIPVEILPTSNIKEYPFIYALVKANETKGILYEYRDGEWIPYGNGSNGIWVGTKEECAKDFNNIENGTFVIIINKNEGTGETHTHDYVCFVTKEPTYSQTGTKTCTCFLCGESYTEEIPALVDSINPAGVIRIGTNEYATWKDTVSFETYYKDNQTVTIEATDNETGVKEIAYYLATAAIGASDIGMVNWTVYNDAFEITPNNNYIVYARITDNADNVTYICSDGIVMDNIPPVFQGLEDGGTYPTGTVLTVEEGATLTVNNNVVDLVNNTYTFTEAMDNCVLSLTDKAGNTNSINIIIKHVCNFVDGICEWCGKKEYEDFNLTESNYLQSGLTTLDGDVQIPATFEYEGQKYKTKSVTLNNVNNITSLSLPSSVTEIGYIRSTSLETVTMTNNVTSINGFRCSSLKNIVLSSGLQEIPSYCFSDCVSITNIGAIRSGSSIEIPNTIKTINFNAFENCTNLTEVSIPEGVITIGSNIFYNCINLKTISIPNSCEYINNIGNCGSITTIHYNTDAEYKSSSGVFSGCCSEKGAVVYFGEKLTKLPDISAIFKQVIIKSNNIQSIPSAYFYRQNMLTNVEIHEGVIEIGYKAFYECTNLNNILLPSTLTKIEYDAFYGCTNLSNLTLPSTITEIEMRAFYNVPHITYHGTATGSPWGALSIN